MFKLPQNNWKQNNRSDILGDLKETFNIDPNSNVGKIRTTRTKRITTGDGEISNFGPVSALVYFSNAVRVFSNGLQYDGGNSPFDSLTQVTADPMSVGVDDGDAVNFNSEIYGTADDDINKWDGSSESTVSVNGLTSNTHHLLATFTPDGNGERLYVTEGGDKVWSVNTSDTLATSSTYTLDLNLAPDYQITFLVAGEDRLWIGVSSAGNNISGGQAIVLGWDGITANSPSAKYYLHSSRIMAGVIKDDVPYIMDSLGRLLVFNGGVFSEIDRLPLDDKTMQNTSSNLHQQAIHSKGMAVDGEEILICVSNLRDNSSGVNATFNDFPAGVWAWNSRNGLYHKFSPSYQAVADTGTTNLTDYGQFRVAFAGPIKVFETQNPTPSDGGRVVFGMSYFLDGGDNLTAATDIQYGLWTNDTHDDTEQGGYIITPKIHSSVFRDKWNKIYAALSDLYSGDRCVVKYRIDDTELYTKIEWRGTDAFEPTEDPSDFTQGDEVQIVQGTGSGMSAPIERVESGAGYYVALKENITGATGTSVAKLAKWRQLGEITGTAVSGFTIGEEANWIQFKIYMEWTGAKELYSLLVDNKPSITL